MTDSNGSTMGAGDTEAVLRMKTRRELIKDNPDLPPYLTQDPFPSDPDRDAIGIAFSGGGIRSATISLGSIQALAKAERLFDFDYMSTVSGGGYIGSFLGNLFIPQTWRSDENFEQFKPGDDKTRLSPNGGVAEQIGVRFAFAMKTLEAAPDDKAFEIAKPDQASKPNPPEAITSMRNPVQWLRENGRYLAPNGASDYVNAATYLSRNWLAMIYVFVIPMAMVLLLSTGFSIGIFLIRFPGVTTYAQSLVDTLGAAQISTVIVPAVLCLFLALAAGGAYWTTGILQWFGSDKPDGLRRAQRSVAFALIGAAILAWWLLSPHFMPPPAGSVPQHACAHSVAAGPCAVGTSGKVGAALFWFGSAMLAASGVFALLCASPKTDKELCFYLIDTRRRLTQTASFLNLRFVWCVALAIVDTLGIQLHNTLLISGWKKAEGGLVAAAAPAGAWIINRFLSGSGGKGSLLEKLAPFRDPIALVAGIALFGTVAVGADTLVQFIVWQKSAWPADFAAQGVHALNLPTIYVIGSALIILTAINGLSTGFINLSSLHNYYMTRLTRTYLGAANEQRMLDVNTSGSTGNIRDSHPDDDMSIVHYQKFITPAPLHLINVTLNKTQGRDDSAVVERDRKGVPMVFAPEGLLVNAAAGTKYMVDYALPAYANWTDLRNQTELLSVGQLCAISGAAVSTGMGANTSLGLALALTFGNIRLGYWWNVKKLIKARASALPDTEKNYHPTPFNTYGYLLREMTAQFRTNTALVYLSDGGHFENSGAYELLRRKVKLAVVLDNGADPDFTFEDLENLVRKARLDLGLVVSIATVEEIGAKLLAETRSLFLNDLDQGWRQSFKDPAGKRFALLLKVTSTESAAPPRWIVWIKPRVVPDDEIDVQGYALANPTFPHETTANQFFNEAQWESYRRIGERAMTDLLQSVEHADLFRNLAR